MLFTKIQNLIKLPIVLIIIGALVLGFFCVGMFSKSATHMTMLGDTQSLSLSSEQECCGSSISISHHFDTWKNITLAVPDKVRDSLMMLALGLVLILGGSWLSLRDHYPFPNLDILRLKLYIRQNPDLLLFNHLKLAFARGILNPKIY